MGETKGTVLVVEDDVGIRKMLTFILERSGYDVLTAATLDTGNKLLSVLPKASAIIADATINTRNDGLEWAVAQQETGRKVVLFTAYAMETDKLPLPMVPKGPGMIEGLLAFLDEALGTEV